MIGVLTQKKPFSSKNRWIACASADSALWVSRTPSYR